MTDDKILREALSAAADGCWHSFAATVATTDVQRETLLRGGKPDHISLNAKEGVPQMSWDQSHAAMVDVWGFFQVRPDNDSTAPEIALSTPFRQIELSRLPEGSKFLPIHDPRHTATAAVEEVIGMIQRDMVRALERYEGEQAWRALRSHAAFLSAAARTSLDRLAEDDFRDWKRPALDGCAIAMAPERVATLALTTRAQQTLALGFVARAYAKAQEDADDKEEQVQARIEHVVKSVDAMVLMLRRMLGVLNESLISTAKLAFRRFTTAVIFRPLPAGVPILAVVPDGS